MLTLVGCTSLRKTGTIRPFKPNFARDHVTFGNFEHHQAKALQKLNKMRKKNKYQNFFCPFLIFFPLNNSKSS